MTRRRVLTQITAHPSDKRIYAEGSDYVELQGISTGEDGILDIMALKNNASSRSDSAWRQALFLRMFEELKVGPLYFPSLQFEVRLPKDLQSKWFESRSFSKWVQQEEDYAGPLDGQDGSFRDWSLSHQWIGWDFEGNYSLFIIQAPLYVWLRWLYSKKRTEGDPLVKYAEAVEQFIGEIFPNVYVSWLEYTDGIHITKAEAEELVPLLAGKVLSTRLFHKLTGEAL